MTIDEIKKQLGWAGLQYIRPFTIVGVGTGSTVSHFIDALATSKHQIKGAISSSEMSSIKLKSLDIPLFNLNDVSSVDIYIDSADEINSQMQMIKGGGGALTREKIIAAVAKKFICIVDSSKKVEILGTFPLPIEVIPMARSWVTKEMLRLGGIPEYRKGITTDNGNIILDVKNLRISNPIELEETINNIPGVVTVGLFARRSADIALIGSQYGIQTVIKKT
ncbi:ribose-5-phosphate isomerase RpiA [Candidatus Schneideria nysicola]|uniref:ribose-5-phosphate isomerase RpiA n=1 Tax=Candidatus Schneideria nysicola TaxID=1081631 RepID=UPI001CAA53FF|nr:ribose-5-phosphate isomerase RpiA [Candidatus Schneideria nysicola]UAJ65909.1 ribose-5-phosphate isomerase RpiA [Candidatus Schneideria nysicola]